MNSRFSYERRTRAVITAVALGLLGVFSAPGAAQSAPASAQAKLVVEVTGFHSDKGQLLLRLYNAEEGFPSDAKKALREVKHSISKGRATVELANLPPGSYAVGCVHDENGDGKLERNFVGAPKEGVGASNDARGRMGPPSWKDARFELKQAATQIQIHVTY
jgi:uncharacterized protein (DUF2141 family)